ncbi:MAG: hypothetical protein PVF82_08335, partial [Gammaproteobacteria bacterium]
FVSVRARLMPDSENFYVYLADGTYEAYVNLFPTEVVFDHSGGSDVSSINTSDFHWYSIRLVNGRVSYSLDGVEIFSGVANLEGSIPGSTSDPTLKYLFIGDIWGSGDRGVGSVAIDDVIISTPILLPRD